MESLVRTIVRDVLEGLRSKAFKPCVLVLAGRNERLGANIANYLENDADIVFLGEDAGGRVPARRILPFLSCADMAALAMGSASGPALTETLHLLLRGLKVEVLEYEYRAHAETAPPALYALYESHAKALSSFGLEESRAKSSAELRCPERLVTEATVRRARANGAFRLLVPARALITPLAADTAKELRVSIVTEL